MERTDPIVKITEPGRTPLHLVVRQPVKVGRGCDDVLLAESDRTAGNLLAAVALLLFAVISATVALVERGNARDGADPQRTLRSPR